MLITSSIKEHQLNTNQLRHQLGTNQCAGDKIGNEAEIVDSLRYDHLGTPATSLGEVNVENFGSEGDGETDDTEVINNGDSNGSNFFNCLIDL